MIKAIIIDDEERARRAMKNLLLNFCEGVEVLACCKDVLEGVEKINELKPDVVFCDIEMPGHSGLELLSFFKEVNFELIFATGYNDFAIQAFEMSAIDYLLKPIQIEKLEKSIEKLKKSLLHTNIDKRLEALKNNFNADDIYKIAFPVSDGLMFVEVENISFLEADGSYCTIWLNDNSKILVSKKLKYFDDLLKNRAQFYRIHRSSLININAIQKYSKADSHLVLNNNKIVKISRDKKADFEQYIKEINYK